MKAIKLLLTLFVLIGLASCSDDDEPSSPDTDRIVGEWRIQSLTYDGEEVEFSSCQLQSSIKFFANGNVTTTDFYEDIDDECISDIYSEKWTNRGNNVYRITDEDGITYDVTILFSNNNNVFTITEEDEDGTYVISYRRI